MKNAAHKVERAMVGKGIEAVLAYTKEPEDREKNLLQLVDIAERIADDHFKKHSYEATGN